jgi:predicted 2-oxoglutarate/Fe(II)-dependent dioxygenase YbiX
MIIFDSDTFHGVEPITEGRREALIIWAVHKSKVMQWSELCEVPTLDPDPA